MDGAAHNPHWTIPTGTQVVTRVEVRNVAGKVAQPRGAVGVVVEGPTAEAVSYRIRFPDLFEAQFARDEFELLKHFKEGDLAAQPAHNLYDRVIYRCIVGS